MRILLVEDDKETSHFIAKGLRDTGNHVQTAQDGRAGLKFALDQTYDVLIVDRMLPELDGLSLVKEARAAKTQAPVLLLTAMATLGDKIEGLQGGADDYLVKPFAFEELVARVNALARRPALREEQPVLRVADLSLDRLKRTVHRGDKEMNLQQREIQILELLMLHAGEIVTRSMLLEQIWGFRFDPGTNIVETHMSRVRSKIDRGDDLPLIHTVRGAGYVIRDH